MALLALVAALHAGFVIVPPSSRVTSCTSAARCRAACGMGLFDGFFADPGKSTRVPAGFAKASHIVISGDDAAEQAAALKERISAGEITFEEAAATYSSCPSKGKGGSLEIFSSLGVVAGLPYEGKDVTAFDTIVFSPAVALNEIHLLTTEWGTHLVRIEGRG